MEELFLVKDKRITLWDCSTLGGSRITKQELIEAFGKEVFNEIQRFGFYIIK